MTCGRTNGLVNVSFQPVKSILLITTNYFSSIESRNLERPNANLNWCKLLSYGDQYNCRIALKSRKIVDFIEY